MVSDELVGPGLEATESVLVGRQDFGALDGPDLEKRLEVVAQRVRELLRVHRDVWADAGEHVVAREEQASLGSDEAEVARRVTRGPDGSKVPTRRVDGVTILDQAIGEGHVHKALDLHRRGGEVGQALSRDAGELEEPGHAIDEVIGLDVALLQERRVGRMEPDPRACRIAHASGQPVVIRVDVGDHDAGHVAHRAPSDAKPLAECIPRLVGVPPRVDQGDALVRLEAVDEDIAKRVVGDWDGDRPEPWSNLLDLRQNVGGPRCLLCGPGDREVLHRQEGIGRTPRRPMTSPDGREGGI